MAAFIVEPIQGKGVYMAPPEYWHEAQALCRKHKTLLVLDEVQTGLGRTGKFFCFEHWDLTPDIITVSKALSGGFVPLGAMLTSDRVFSSVYSSLEKALKHSTTFGRNQLAMVAGLATLATFDEENIVERARLSGLAFEAALAPLVERYEMFHEVRGKGLMIGLEFGPPQSKALRRRFNGARAASPRHFLPDDGGAPLPSPSDTDPSGGRQRQHHQTPPPAHLWPGRDRLFRRSAGRCSAGRAQWLGAPPRVRPHHGQGHPSKDREGATRGPLCGSRFQRHWQWQRLNARSRQRRTGTGPITAVHRPMPWWPVSGALDEWRGKSHRR